MEDYRTFAWHPFEVDEPVEQATARHFGKDTFSAPDGGSGEMKILRNGQNLSGRNINLNVKFRMTGVMVVNTWSGPLVTAEMYLPLPE